MMTHGFANGYERRGVYSLEEVFSHIGEEVEYDGDLVPIKSFRFYTFVRSLECAYCGLRGMYFAKERSAKAKYNKETNTRTWHVTTQTWHFNLYAIVDDEEGLHEVMITKDHIVPSSKGGPDTLENLQTMCGPCNHRKGSKQDRKTNKVGQ